jgi:hypothetical protein
MKKFLKNNKGDITIAILVIGIVVVCFVALLSFYLAKLDTDKNFNYIGKITKVSSDMERYLSGEPIRVEPTDGKGKHLYDSIKHSTGLFGLGETKISFEVKYYLSK